jgi:type II secretory pathway pseudopilin PulG
MRYLPEPRPKRGGFTIVELLVAAAVSILLMLIVTEAFKRGLDMFRHLKAAGDLNERLRTAARALRDDLASFHFEDGVSSDRQYLSGIDLRESASPNDPPTDGFFRIIQQPEPGNPPDPINNPLGEPCVFEGTDSDGVLFSRATRHALHFTVFRRETSPTVKNPVDPSYLFRTLEPYGGAAHPDPAFPSLYVDPPDFREAGVFASRWAEVCYFLAPNGRTANGTPLFNLYRRQKLLLPRAGGYAGIPAGPVPVAPPPYRENPEISARTQVSPPVGRFYNRIGDVTQPRFRMGMLPAIDDGNDPNLAGLFAAPTGSYQRLEDDLGLADERAGDDILLPDVISFEIKATWDADSSLLEPRRTLTVPGLGVGPTSLYPNSDFPFDYLPPSPQNLVLANRVWRVFDTWCDRPGTPYGEPRPSAGAGDPGGIGPAWSDVTPTPNPNLTGARIPLRIRVKAILVRMRIWDAKTEQTRQLTVIMDM